MVIGHIIDTIIFTESPIEVKLALMNMIFNKQTDVHGFVTALLHCVGKNIDNTLVIYFDGSSHLRMSHLNHRLANSEKLFSDGKYRYNSGLGDGRYDVRNNLKENENIAIP